MGWAAEVRRRRRGRGGLLSEGDSLWEVPGFGVRTHFERLIALQERLESEGELSFYAGKFLIEARK